jgi:hypothetical protein
MPWAIWALLTTTWARPPRPRAVWPSRCPLQPTRCPRRRSRLPQQHRQTFSTIQAQPELAIIFLKASVDIREAIRGDIRGLDTDLQQSFTDTVADDYRLLADLLLQQDRILEAQRVLDLLKVQELDDYLQDVRRNGRTERCGIPAKPSRPF